MTKSTVSHKASANCGLIARAESYGEVLRKGARLLRTAPLTVVEGQARQFADAVYSGPADAWVWDATKKRRAPDNRGGIVVDRLQQLEWALERRCLKCGKTGAASHLYGTRGHVLCHICELCERGSDRLRRGLATFVLEIRDAYAPPLPEDAMAPLSADEAVAYRRLVAETKAALDATEPDERGVKRI